MVERIKRFQSEEDEPSHNYPNYPLEQYCLLIFVGEQNHKVNDIISRIQREHKNVNYLSSLEDKYINKYSHYIYVDSMFRYINDYVIWSIYKKVIIINCDEFFSVKQYLDKYPFGFLNFTDSMVEHVIIYLNKLMR